jgi:UTP--glucose-1-phosphate uridylyltransferase
MAESIFAIKNKPNIARSPVRKAVFPVAGLGTRFLPATKAQPKEMLPVVDKPLIQYAIEEAYSAGIRHMIFVTGRNKRSIEDHFDTAVELEKELEASHKDELLALIRAIKPSDMGWGTPFYAQNILLGMSLLPCCWRMI